MNLRENIKMFDNEIGPMGMEWRWLEDKHTNRTLFNTYSFYSDHCSRILI